MRKLLHAWSWFFGLSWKEIGIVYLSGIATAALMFGLNVRMTRFFDATFAFVGAFIGVQIWRTGKLLLGLRQRVSA